MKRIRTTISVIVSAAVCASLAASIPASAGPPAVQSAAAAGAKVKTDFWFKHNAYGTKVTGNPLLESGPTAYSYLPCTKRAGASHRNEVAGATVPGGFLNAEGIESHGWTSQKNGVAAVNSRNTIAGVSLAQGRVQVDAIKTRARAFNDGEYRMAGRSSIVGLTIDGRRIELGNKYRKFTVPGVGTLHVNQKMRKKGPGFSQIRVVGLRLVSHLEDTVIRVGHARARISDSGKGGPFAGPAFASRVLLADGTARSGRTALQPLGCAGTNGKVRQNSTANAIEATDSVNLETVSSKVWTHRTETKGWTRATIETAELAGGLVKVEGLTARAFVDRQGDKVIRHAKGTKIASLKVGPKRIDVDRLLPGDSITVPGVATVTFKKVHRTPNSIVSTALEVVLFPGTPLESTVELARARMQVRAS